MARGSDSARINSALMHPVAAWTEWSVLWKRSDSPSRDCMIWVPSETRPTNSSKPTVIENAAAKPKSAFARTLARMKFLAKEQPYETT